MRHPIYASGCGRSVHHTCPGGALIHRHAGPTMFVACIEPMSVGPSRAPSRAQPSRGRASKSPVRFRSAPSVAQLGGVGEHVGLRLGALGPGKLRCRTFAPSERIQCCKVAEAVERAYAASRAGQEPRRVRRPDQVSR